MRPGCSPTNRPHDSDRQTDQSESRYSSGRSQERPRANRDGTLTNNGHERTSDQQRAVMIGRMTRCTNTVKNIITLAQGSQLLLQNAS